MKRFAIILLLFIMTLSSCVEIVNTPYPNESTADEAGVTETQSEETKADEGWPEVEQELYFAEFPYITPTMKPDPADYSIDWSDEVRNTYIKLPKTYEENVDGLIFNVNFFTDKYKMYSFIHSRVTVTNTLSEPIEYTKCGIDPAVAGCFVKNGTDIKAFSLFTKQTELCQAFYVDAYNSFTIEPGGTLVIEVMFFADNTFFEPGAEYIYTFSFDKQYMSSNAKQSYSISIPIEVCAPNAE
jgi:hypothetical protein